MNEDAVAFLTRLQYEPKSSLPKLIGCRDRDLQSGADCRRANWFPREIRVASDASAQGRGGMAARGAGADGNAGGARAAAGRRPATCPAPANHSPPLRPMLTRLRDYTSKFIKIPYRRLYKTKTVYLKYLYWGHGGAIKS